MAAAEAAVSRLYGGIHFRSADEDGLSAGIAIGEWAVTHSMQPSAPQVVEHSFPEEGRP
jgi:hypothetical protein